MSPVRPFLSLVLLIAVAPAARAEIAVMASGKILYVDRFEREDELITLFITGGGEVTVPAELVVNVVPNEIVEELETTEATDDAIRGLGLFPHLAPLIEPAAAKYAIDPNLVAAVIWAESSGDPNAVSAKGALGLMQLMPQTARELGIERPVDPQQNVDGGTRYLRQMLDAHHGDVSLALAAYNAGPDAVRRHGGVPPYRETRSYVGRVLDMYERARDRGSP
ncbi:MAG TPA: lytic transglycosylase domain-containing protein [Vicinamibacteria bacterium]|nr:lytic transglycosylase domain-containing protein [Vicinamibacteria bacterium]